MFNSISRPDFSGMIISRYLGPFHAQAASADMLHVRYPQPQGGQSPLSLSVGNMLVLNRCFYENNILNIQLNLRFSNGVIDKTIRKISESAARHILMLENSRPVPAKFPPQAGVEPLHTATYDNRRPISVRHRQVDGGAINTLGNREASPRRAYGRLPENSVPEFSEPRQANANGKSAPDQKSARRELMPVRPVGLAEYRFSQKLQHLQQDDAPKPLTQTLYFPHRKQDMPPFLFADAGHSTPVWYGQLWELLSVQGNVTNISEQVRYNDLWRRLSGQNNTANISAQVRYSQHWRLLPGKNSDVYMNAAVRNRSLRGFLREQVNHISTKNDWISHSAPGTDYSGIPLKQRLWKVRAQASALPLPALPLTKHSEPPPQASRLPDTIPNIGHPQKSGNRMGPLNITPPSQIKAQPAYFYNERAAQAMRREILAQPARTLFEPTAGADHMLRPIAAQNPQQSAYGKGQLQLAVQAASAKVVGQPDDPAMPELSQNTRPSLFPAQRQFPQTEGNPADSAVTPIIAAKTAGQPGGPAMPELSQNTQPSLFPAQRQFPQTEEIPADSAVAPIIAAKAAGLSTQHRFFHTGDPPRMVDAHNDLPVSARPGSRIYPTAARTIGIPGNSAPEARKLLPEAPSQGLDLSVFTARFSLKRATALQLGQPTTYGSIHTAASNAEMTTPPPLRYAGGGSTAGIESRRVIRQTDATSAPILYRKEAQTATQTSQPPAQAKFNDDIAFIKKKVEQNTLSTQTVRANTAINLPGNAAPPQVQTVGLEQQVNAIADQVYNALERRLRSERMRKGLL